MEETTDSFLRSVAGASIAGYGSKVAEQQQQQQQQQPNRLERMAMDDDNRTGQGHNE
jgi:hypothetical protein